MQHVPRERGYFQQVSRDHFLEGSTFPNKYNTKTRKRKPVTCSVTENGRFQEICTVSFLLIDDIHNVDSFTRTAAKMRPLDPALFETRRTNFNKTLVWENNTNDQLDATIMVY